MNEKDIHPRPDIIQSLDFHLICWTLEVLELCQILSDLVLLQYTEWSIFTNNSDLNGPGLDLTFLTGRLFQSCQRVEHQLLQSWLGELSQIVFEVGSGRLGPGSDWVGLVFVVVSTWTGLIQVWPIPVDACYQQPNAVRSLWGFLSLVLRFYCYFDMYFRRPCR